MAYVYVYVYVYTYVHLNERSKTQKNELTFQGSKNVPMNLINRIQTMPPQIITHKAFEASKEMATIEGTKGSWYSILMKWLNNVLDIKKLTIFQYYKTLQNYEQNKV